MEQLRCNRKCCSRFHIRRMHRRQVISIHADLREQSPESTPLDAQGGGRWDNLPSNLDLNAFPTFVAQEEGIHIFPKENVYGVPKNVAADNHNHHGGIELRNLAADHQRRVAQIFFEPACIAMSRNPLPTRVVTNSAIRPPSSCPPSIFLVLPYQYPRPRTSVSDNFVLNRIFRQSPWLLLDSNSSL
jgi:hypothetical protein